MQTLLVRKSQLRHDTLIVHRRHSIFRLVLLLLLILVPHLLLYVCVCQLLPKHRAIYIHFQVSHEELNDFPI